MQFFFPRVSFYYCFEKVTFSIPKFWPFFFLSTIKIPFWGNNTSSAAQQSNAVQTQTETFKMGKHSLVPAYKTTSRTRMGLLSGGSLHRVPRVYKKNAPTGIFMPSNHPKIRKPAQNNEKICRKNWSIFSSTSAL